MDLTLLTTYLPVILKLGSLASILGVLLQILHILPYVLAVIAIPYLLWVWYVAVMRLEMVRDAGQLTPAMKVFGYPTLAIGLMLDLFVNTVFGTIIFLELPHEYTLSSRLTRWSNDAAKTWRTRLALAIRTSLLDNIDPAGVHKG